MPYSNIVFIKVRLELLSDYRFTDQLNDRQKLLYLGLLILSGSTLNKVPNDPAFVKRQLNLESSISNIRKDLDHIATVFCKVLIKNGILSFRNFEKNHNFIIGQKEKKGTPKEFRRNSKGNEKELSEEKRKEEKRKEEKRGDFQSLSDLSKQDPSIKATLEKMGYRATTTEGVKV